MKVLVADYIADAGKHVLQQYAEVETRSGMQEKDLLSIIGQFNGLVVRSTTKVTADVIRVADRLQVIGRAGVGVDNIDVEAATKRGIVVVNSPEGNITSTAEHVIAMLLAVARRIPQSNRSLHEGVWGRESKGVQIRNKVLGIIGLGRVGTAVSELALGLHMSVLAHDPLISQNRAETLGVKMVSLETLLSESDFISLHVPLNRATRGLIGPDQLSLMKPTAMIINCARGGILDEKALYQALNHGRLAGAALDVFEREPALDNILLTCDKVVATPHIAASTTEAEDRVGLEIAEEIVEILKGSPPKNPVNAPKISRDALGAMSPYLEVGAMISRIASQLLEGQWTSLTITYYGDVCLHNSYPIKTAILAGMMEGLTDERVNLVNVDVIAQERGLSISERTDTTHEGYSNMIALRLSTTSGDIVVAGSSIFGRTYLTRIDDYRLEIEPTGSYMLLTQHKDRPGMVGAVGTILGNADVNISQMQVCRGVTRNRQAMMAICLDTPLTPEGHQKILAIPDMYKTYLIRFGA